MLLAQNCLQINYNHNFFKLQIIILDLSPTGTQAEGKAEPAKGPTDDLSVLPGGSR